MPDSVRSDVFWACTDDDNAYREYTHNCIYFFTSLDEGMFDEHQEDWVFIYKQSVKWYGKEKYTSQQLVDFEYEMPGFLYLPVNSELRDRELNPKVLPAKAVRSQYSLGEYMV